MKKLIYLLVVVVCMTSCKKELGTCKDYKEAQPKERLINADAVDFQAFKDTLEKYPEILKPSQYQIFPFGRSLKCYVYYNGLLVFSENYFLNAYNMDSIGTHGLKLSRLAGISTEPLVSYQDAIKEARYQANFDNLCISYRLMLFNRHFYNNTITPDYRLVWRISGGDNDFPSVILDAKNKEVLQVNNDRYWVY